jgi:hypothetical protein
MAAVGAEGEAGRVATAAGERPAVSVGAAGFVAERVVVGRVERGAGLATDEALGDVGRGVVGRGALSRAAAVFCARAPLVGRAPVSVPMLPEAVPALPVLVAAVVAVLGVRTSVTWWSLADDCRRAALACRAATDFLAIAHSPHSKRVSSACQFAASRDTRIQGQYTVSPPTTQARVTNRHTSVRWHAGAP